MPETRYDAYAKSGDFIRRYSFPGGHLPSISQLVAAINKGSGKKLIVEHVENIGPHYAKTLRLWKEKFMANFDEEIRPSLLVEFEGTTKTDVEIFRRKWEYHFTYCEAGVCNQDVGGRHSYGWEGRGGGDVGGCAVVKKSLVENKSLGWRIYMGGIEIGVFFEGCLVLSLSVCIYMAYMLYIPKLLALVLALC